VHTHTHTHTNVYKLTNYNRDNRVAYSRFIGILQLSFACDVYGIVLDHQWYWYFEWHITCYTFSI